MDMTWIMDRIAVGGGIECAENMEQVARAGITHIINMQIEFNDSELAAVHGIRVLNNGVYNDCIALQPWPWHCFVRWGGLSRWPDNSLSVAVRWCISATTI